jgi:light-harvesting protein B-800-850 alpha chain
MNQGKVWRVVNPSVGVPIFLGAVVVASLVVHGALMIKTDWFGAYWNGASLSGKGKAVAMAPATTSVATAPAAAPTK